MYKFKKIIGSTSRIFLQSIETFICDCYRGLTFSIIVKYAKFQARWYCTRDIFRKFTTVHTYPSPENGSDWKDSRIVRVAWRKVRIFAGGGLLFEKKCLDSQQLVAEQHHFYFCGFLGYLLGNDSNKKKNNHTPPFQLWSLTSLWCSIPLLVRSMP